MPKAKLDHEFVSNAECQPGKAKTDYYDTTVTGFVLEVRRGGKTFALRYLTQGGRQRQFKIGRVQDISFAQAKKRAQQLRSEVVMGGDPGAKKDLAKSIPLYIELADMHLADAETHQRSYKTTEMYVRRHILPKWGKVRLTDIDVRAVSQWLADKRAEGLAPATVEKLRVTFGRSFVLGQRWGVPGCDKNPTRGIARKPLNNARERFLTAEEAARLRLAVAESQNPQLQHIVGLLLLTGARVRELLDARWEHINVDRQAWLIPTSKTGRSRHVPLSGAALAIVASLPRFKGCPWLVPNPETLKPFVSIKGAWKRAIRVAKLPGLRIHDLRHSAASFMVNSGIDLFAVGKVLGHASYQSTQRYAHLANDTLLKAVEAGAAIHERERTLDEVVCRTHFLNLQLARPFPNVARVAAALPPPRQADFPNVREGSDCEQMAAAAGGVRRYGAGRIFPDSHAKSLKLGTGESAAFGGFGNGLGRTKAKPQNRA